MTALISYIGVSEVYPEHRVCWSDFSRILRRLSRTDTVVHLGRVAALVSKKGRAGWFEMQQRAVAFIGPSAQVVERLNMAVGRRPLGETVPIFRGMLLELLRWVVLVCEDKEGDGTTFEQEPARDDLFAALLIAGELWARRVYRRFDPMRPSPDVSLAVRMAVHRQAHSENDPIAESPHLFARGLAIVGEHLPRRCRRFPEWFESATGVSLEDHLMFVTVLYAFLVEGTQLQPDGLPANTGLFRVDELGVHFTSQTMAERLQAFLRHSTIDIEHLREALWPDGAPENGPEALRTPPRYDLRALRDRPIVRTKRGGGIVLEPSYFGEFCLSWPVFQIKEPHRDEVLREYGGAFEDYCLELFERIFPRSNAFVRPYDRNVTLQGGGGNLHGEFDAVLRYGATAVCFEIKHGFIADAGLAPGDESRLVADVRKKFGEGRKGMSQLAKSLLRLGRTAEQSWPESLRGVEVILPVLVVSDSKVDGHWDKVLCECFCQVLGRRGDMRWHPFPEFGESRHFRLSKPMICSVSDLEWLESMSERRSLYDIFSAYAAERREIDFASFLATHAEFRRMFRISRHSLQMLDVALKRAMGTLFGGTMPGD